MKQTKKPGYRLYPTMEAHIHRGARKYLGREAKKYTPKDFIRHTAETMTIPAFFNSLDFFVLAEEWFWKRQGAEAIFPASAEVLGSLQRAKFDISREGTPGIELPFPSFVLAMPKSFEPEPGLKLGAILATWYTYEKGATDILQPYSSAIGLPSPGTPRMVPHEPGERALALTMSVGTGRMQYLRTNVLESDLPAILAARSPEEFASAVGSYSSGSLLFHGLDDHDRKLQFYAFRLIAALGVYHQATEGRYLRDGFPDAQAPRVIEGEALKNHRSHTLSIASRTRSEPSEHYRAWHFRQLRADRYYQGEHAEKPRGSRWTFVKETTVGEPISPSTQDVPPAKS